jgi:hypothetical protein
MNGQMNRLREMGFLKEIDRSNDKHIRLRCKALLLFQQVYTMYLTLHSSPRKSPRQRIASA